MQAAEKGEFEMQAAEKGECEMQATEKLKEQYTIQELAEIYGLTVSGMRAVLLMKNIPVAEIRTRGKRQKVRLYSNEVFDNLATVGYVPEGNVADGRG